MEEAVPIRAVLGFQRLLQSDLARDLLDLIRIPDGNGKFQILTGTRQRADSLRVLEHRVVLILFEYPQLIVVEPVKNGC
jgi:hypothetical protein